MNKSTPTNNLRPTLGVRTRVRAGLDPAMCASRKAGIESTCYIEWQEKRHDDQKYKVCLDGAEQWYQFCINWK
jgi:hypothetical protein